MTATGFSHFTVACKDIATSIDFYRDVLDLDVLDRKLPPGFPQAAIGSFKDGKWCVHLFAAEPARSTGTGPLRHVSLRVVGYDATKARLAQRGIAHREFTFGDRHLVQFLDPDGLEIELTFDPKELPNGPIPWVADTAQS